MVARAMEETGANEGGDGDNPFSFKSFVKRASTDGGVKGATREGTGRGKKTRSAAALPFPEEGEPAGLFHAVRVQKPI